MMLEYIRGALVSHAPGHAILDAPPFGYRVMIPVADGPRLPAPGEDVRLFLHVHVHEDVTSYYGFLRAEHRDLFRLLTSVNGVGPKVAMKMFTASSPETIARHLAEGDEYALKKVKGLGPKTAVKMIVDLKDKVGALGLVDGPAAPAVPAGARAQAELALRGLGFTDAEIRPVLDELWRGGAPALEEAIRQALVRLARA